MRPIFCVAAIVFASALSVVGAALADDDDYPSWRPSSQTAMSITGPIIVQPTRLHAANANFQWHIDGSAAAFKPGQGSIPARIYAVTGSANPALLNGNKLCGETPPAWIVVVPLPPEGLELDAFTGTQKPANQHSPGLCATFAYIR